MRAATEGSLPPVMPQGNVVEVLGHEVRQGLPGELMLESSPSRQSVICLCLGAYRKPIFLVLHLKIKLFPMFSITIDLVGKYRTQATARRRRT